MKKESLSLIKKTEYTEKNDNPIKILSNMVYVNDDTFEKAAVFEFLNRSGRKVDFVCVEVRFFNSAGSLLGTKIVDYKDLKAKNKVVFGEGILISIPSLMADGVDAKIKMIGFCDGEIIEYDSDGNEMVVQTSKKFKISKKDLWETSDKEKRTKKPAIRVIAVIAAVVLAAAWYYAKETFRTETERKLNEAAEAFDMGDYNLAELSLDKLLNNKLSEKSKKKAVMLRAFTAIHKEDYSAALRHFAMLGCDEDAMFYIRRLNTALSGIAAAGEKHSVLLETNGQAKAVGDNEFGQCNTHEWTDITAVAAGARHTVGLKTDGTVLAAGDNGRGQCSVKNWENIVAVACGKSHSVGAFNTGRVTAVGDNDSGQCDVGSWSGIIAVAAGEKHTAGLRQDGTVIAAGDNSVGACDVGDWRNIISLAAGANFTVGVSGDGKVYVAGDNSCGQYDGSSFEGITTVCAGDFYLLALGGGRIKGAGDNQWHQTEVELWKQTISAAGGLHHSIGICANGTVYAVGDNKSGQCDVGEFSNIGLPEKAVERTALLDIRGNEYEQNRE